MKALHYLPMVTVLVMFSGSSQAAPPEHCQSQARELAIKAGSDIFPEMNASQRGRLQQLAAEVCAKYNQGVAQTQEQPADTGDQADVADAEANVDSDDEGNWFTKILTPPEEKFADDPPNRPERGRLHQ